MRNLILYTAALFFLTAQQAVYSQVNFSKTGQSTMNFLLVATSSRAAAMGEAYTTLGSGSEAMFFNPAGLSVMPKQFDISVNYTQWIADINYISGGAAWNLGSIGVIGFNMMTVDYGTIKGTSLVPPGLESVYKNNFVDNGNVGNVAAYAVGLTYAKAISEAFSIGGTVKIAGQNLGVNNFYDGTSKENDAAKLVFDAGIKYTTSYKSFSFGMYIRNFASNIKRELVDEQLPLVFAIGAGMNVMEVINSSIADENKLNVAADFLHQNSYSERVNIGMEYKYQNMISLRGGYQTNRDLASWSGGLGFNTSFSDYDVELSYSYSAFEIFDYVNRLSLVISF